jgi:hypothetical protein
VGICLAPVQSGQQVDVGHQLGDLVHVGAAPAGLGDDGFPALLERLRAVQRGQHLLDEGPHPLGRGTGCDLSLGHLVLGALAGLAGAGCPKRDGL